VTIFRSRRTHEDFSNEIQAHIDLETDRLVAEGWSRERASAEARKIFGNVALVKERFYETSRWIWLEQIVQDVRYATRTLRHNPAFFATAVVTLTLGIGLATVAFTVFNAYLLRPYAIRKPSTLYQIEWRSQKSGGQGFRWRDYLELRDRIDLFEGVIAEHTQFVTSQGRPLAAALVSDNYFDTLGPGVLLGRASTADEGGRPVVLSHQAWTRLFARDPAVIGGPLDLNGGQFTIVGILRPEFTGLGDSPRDVWVSLASYAQTSSPELIGSDQPRSIEITARLREGLSSAQVQAVLTPFMKRMVGTASEGEDVRAEVQPASPNQLSLQMLAILSPIAAAFALVLVTACANVSNVMLARAIARHREIGVRLSLGASRNRVVRQLLTEGIVISVVAGFAALALAAFALWAATTAFFATLPPSVAGILRLVPLGIDHRVFLFAFGTAAVATVLFALMPALQASRLSLIDAVRGQGGTTQQGSRLRHALVIAQVAVSMILVVVAVTLARNGAAIGSLDLGYQTAGVVSINVRAQDGELIRKLVPVLTADPRVAEVAVTGGNPLFIRSRNVAAAPAGRTDAAATRYTFVSPKYFSILRIPIVRGRPFRLDEARGNARSAIISEATARSFWPGQDAIGKSIRIERPNGRPVEELAGYAEVTVVGTVPDVVSGLIVDGRDSSHIYLPMTADSPQTLAALVRGRTMREPGAEALQQSFRQVATDPQIFEALPLEEMRALQIYPLQAASWVGVLLGGLALILSVSGLYGVLIYTLNQRTREIGIRMALGASGAAVVRLIVRQSARLAAAGAMIGLIVAFGALKALSSAIQLQTVALVDAAAFAAGVGVVVAAAALAAYHPASRATRVDPSAALRADA
jgi:predicted permease